MRNTLMIAAVAATFAAPAFATVVAYDTVNGASVAASFVDGDTIGADLVRGSGVVERTDNNFNSRGWTATSLADAEANNDFLEWGFISTDAYDLTDLEIGYDRSPTGPTFIEIFASISGGLFQSIFLDTDVATNSEVNTIDLSGGAFDGVNDVTFRLFGWGGTSALGTLAIETGTVGPRGGFGLAVNGEVAAVSVVPLPAGLPLMLAGLGMLGFMRRRA